MANDAIYHHHYEVPISWNKLENWLVDEFGAT